MHAHNVFYTHWHIDRQMAVQLVQISIFSPFLQDKRGGETTHHGFSFFIKTICTIALDMKGLE